MDDENQTVDATDQDGEECCGAECQCGFDKEVAPDDLALLSLVTGVSSLFLCMGTPGHRFMGLLCGATAVVTGWAAQRTASRREKQAIGGLVCGTIGLTIWLMATWGPHFLARLWG